MVNNLSLKQKIVFMALFIVLFTDVLLLLNGWRLKSEEVEKDLLATTMLNAKLISPYCATSLVFQRENQAYDAISNYEFINTIEAALVYDNLGFVFAEYNKGLLIKQHEMTKKLNDAEYTFTDNYLYFTYPLKMNNELVGKLLIVVSTAEMHAEVLNHLKINGFFTIIITIIAFLITLWAQRVITKPIIHLAGLTKKVSVEDNLEVEAKTNLNDEIGFLYREFNNMLRELRLRRSEQRLIEKKLKVSETRYRELIENQGEGIAVINEDGIFKFSNPATAYIFGIRYGELEGKKITQLINPECKTDFNKEFLTVRKGKKHSFEISVNGINSLQYILITAVPRYEDGFFVGAFLVLHDITQRKEMELQLVEAKELAESSDRFKSEFLAQMSHEIRSPINVILSFTSLLKEELMGKIDPDLAESFVSIEKGGRRIIRTIDLILNMSELQTGIFQINPVKLNLTGKIVPSLMAEYRYLAAQKKLKLVSEHNTEDDIFVSADEYSLEQILSNLIDNAIKYTNEGQVKIVISRLRSSRVTVEITDTGIGISKEYIPFLFESFTQEEMGYTRKFEGNGLGLALVKKYCDVNNIKIDVKSTKGEGTTFKLIF